MGDGRIRRDGKRVRVHCVKRVAVRDEMEMALVSIERDAGGDGEEVWVEACMLPKQLRQIARHLLIAARGVERKRAARGGWETASDAKRVQGGSGHQLRGRHDRGGARSGSS